MGIDKKLLCLFDVEVVMEIVLSCLLMNLSTLSVGSLTD